jgi:hypothetical protein
MKFEQFKTLYLGLRAARAAQDAYIDSIPRDIMDAFFDNEYVNQYDKMVSLVVETMLPSEISDWLFYFLYEWNPGYIIVSSDGVPYKIETEDHIFNFMLKEFTWDA